MKIDIRNHIKNNFKSSNESEIEESIEASINSKDEVVLPGLGVLFEVLWNNCTDKMKDEILFTIHNNV